MIPWPTQVLNGISITSAVFAGLTSVTDQPTDHATQSVTIGRIYIRSSCIYIHSTLMWAKMEYRSVLKRLAWCITPRLVSSSAVGLMLIAALMSWSAANVSLIWRFTIARPSRAGKNSAQMPLISISLTSVSQQLYQKSILIMISSVTTVTWIQTWIYLPTLSAKKPE